MKAKLLILLVVLTGNTACKSQVKIDEFVKNFELIECPIAHVEQMNTGDTLNGKLTNDIIIRKQPERPKLADLKGNLHDIKQYFGLYPDEPDDYLIDIKDEKGNWIEKRCYFFPKTQPIGKVMLNDNFFSLIIKVIGYESTFYDLWSFNKDGKALSVLCLFYGKRDGGPRDEKVTFTIVTSEITKEGVIKWQESIDGHKWNREYKLNNEGYFQLISEKEEGEYRF